MHKQKVALRILVFLENIAFEQLQILQNTIMHKDALYMSSQMIKHLHLQIYNQETFSFGQRMELRMLKNQGLKQLAM